MALAPHPPGPASRGLHDVPRRLLLLGAFATLAAAAGAADGRGAVCASGHLTLLGADLEAGRVLLAPTAGEDLVELSIADGTATLSRRGWPGGLQGGSIAPGPVVAGRPCGDDCLSVVEWRNGEWRPLGESFLADPGSSLVETTRDRSGTPWLVLRGSRDGAGRAGVLAYRAQGREWVVAGRGFARAVGSPFASPSPGDPRAVVVGDLELVAGSGEVRVLEDRPRAADLDGAQVHWLAERRPLLLSGRGDLFEWTPGTQAGWRPVRWRPWGGTGAGDGIGSRHWVEVLPDAGIAGSRAFLWTDARQSERDIARIYLVEWTAKRGWRRVAELDDGLRTREGDRLPFRHVLRFGDGRWLLLAGCVDGPSGTSLAYLLASDAGLGSPHVVPIREK